MWLPLLSTSSISLFNFIDQSLDTLHRNIFVMKHNPNVQQKAAEIEQDYCDIEYLSCLVKI